MADELKRLGIPFVFATGFEPDSVPLPHANNMLLRKPLESDAIIKSLDKALTSSSVSMAQATSNKLLAMLPQHILALLVPELRIVSLPRGAVLEQSSHRVDKVYFLIDCVASLIVVGREGTRIETGLIGSEGMTGAALADGDAHTRTNS